MAALLGLMIAGSSMLSVNLSAAYRTDPDPNIDGKFDILDVIGVSKYLHLQGTLKDWKQADMDGDGQVDVFDYSLMLRELVWKNRKAPTLTSKDLAATVQAASPESVTLNEDFSIGQTRFALELLRESAEDGANALISPYSVSQALGMTANGAAGETLAEMEDVLGGSLDTLNSAFYTFRGHAQNDDRAKLNTANAIWVREGYPVSEAFLQKNADYYGAGAYAAPFDDSTVEDINGWVNDKTDRMIPNLLGEIPEQTELILVNAVTFDAKWLRPYDAEMGMVSDATFTAADGTKQDVVLMNSDGDAYLSDDHAEGFLKYYEGMRYAFAALLPEEGMTPEEYLAGLTPEGLYAMLSKPQKCGVATSLPEFSCDFSANLNESLVNMGMPSAFSSAADFSGMTDGVNGLAISDVIHKTHIEVTPEGTRAGAATAAVMMNDGCINIEKEVVLDRPFVYALVDLETSVPIFIGTLNSVE